MQTGREMGYGMQTGREGGTECRQVGIPDMRGGT